MRRPNRPVLLWLDGECADQRLGNEMRWKFAIQVENLPVEPSVPGIVPPDRNNTTHVAHYLALIAGMEELQSREWHSAYIIVKTRNKLLVNEMRRNWEIRDRPHKPYAKEAELLRESFPHMKFWCLGRDEDSPLEP